jgi:biotin carboxyl carrier protein
MKYLATVDNRVYEIEIRGESEISLDGQAVIVDCRSMGEQPVYSLLIDGKSYEALVDATDSGMRILLRGRSYDVTLEDERQSRLRRASGMEVAPEGEFHLRAPMPGLVVAIPVAEDQAVSRGQDLVILESMKMQNELKSPRDGIVSRIRVQPGDSVEQNQILLIVN